MLKNIEDIKEIAEGIKEQKRNFKEKITLPMLKKGKEYREYIHISTKIIGDAIYNGLGKSLNRRINLPKLTLTHTFLLGMLSGLIIIGYLEYDGHKKGTHASYLCQDNQANVRFISGRSDRIEQVIEEVKKERYSCEKLWYNSKK